MRSMVEFHLLAALGAVSGCLHCALSLALACSCTCSLPLLHEVLVLFVLLLLVFLLWLLFGLGLRLRFLLWLGLRFRFRGSSSVFFVLRGCGSPSLLAFLSRLRLLLFFLAEWFSLLAFLRLLNFWSQLSLGATLSGLSLCWWR